MKKFHFLMMLATLLFAAVGCEDSGLDNNPNGPSWLYEPSITIASAKSTFSIEGGEGKIVCEIKNAKEGVALEAECAAEWVSDLTVNGVEVTFTVAANEAEEARTATLTLSYEGAKDVTVEVRQDGTQERAGVDVLAPGEDPSSLPLISANPADFTTDSTNDVVVRVNVKGTAFDGKNYTDFHAHTGVITSESADDTDWKYVLTDSWEENSDKTTLVRYKDTGIYYLVITGGIQAYYEVPEGERVKKLAFVFRSTNPEGTNDDGSNKYNELKDEGKDIFLAPAGVLNVDFTEPTGNTIWECNKNYTVTVETTNAIYLKLYLNDELVQESDGSAISYRYTTTSEPEDLVFKAEGGNEKGEVETKEIRIAVMKATENAARPSGAREGVTVNGSEATFVLYAPGKKQVVLLGDFNNFAPANDFLMKKDGDYFWLTVKGLDANTEYAYQFLVDGTIRVGDPYATKVLDPWNDKWIEESTYPNLKAYPENAEDMVSVFTTATPTAFSWVSFDRPDHNALAVYELLLRDFSSTSDIDGAMEHLDYLEDLGVNAIELMPIMEFDGNDSWGYNPCFYFAPDKAYGTAEDYKEFINECHKRGMAVIVDVVFNHATGQFPWAKMWWDSANNCTASNNPFFNVSAPHDYSVYHDFNHTYAKTRSYFKEVLQYWLREYNIDGYRFDLTKGIVQNPASYEGSGYSAQRIGFLKEYADAIREVSDDAYIIFEHFCDQGEEDELARYKNILLWSNNGKTGYGESVMGWYEGGDDSDGATWGLMGDFQSNNWLNDIFFTQSGNLLVAQDVVFADANKEGCVFKVRKNRSWDVSYGATDGSYKHSIGQKISLNGTNNVLMNATVGVKYDFYFNPTTMEIWVMDDGKSPSSLRTTTSTRAGSNKSDFSGAFRSGRMNNIETHDEERIAYDVITYGQSWVMTDWTRISDRLAAAYAFHFLSPYPKMMWQFGELGYDYSINYNDRTGRKPVAWDLGYFEDEDRKALYETISKIITFRKQNEDMYGNSVTVNGFTHHVTDGDMGGKQLLYRTSGGSVLVVANFTNKATNSFSINVGENGTWTNLLTGATVNITDYHYTVAPTADELIILVKNN